MKLDFTKLPILEAVCGFLVLALAVVFFFAFTTVEEKEPPQQELAAASGTPTPEASSDGDDDDGGALAIAMHDNSFDPEELTVAAGESVSIAVTNEGAAIHNVRIAGADGEYETDDDAVTDPESVRGGAGATLPWDVPAEPGEIDFRCDFHPSEMTGTITVQ